MRKIGAVRLLSEAVHSRGKVDVKDPIELRADWTLMARHALTASTH
eukprot:COSAG05_NODE_513_length_9084_cov_5.373957_5_plen_46_part_00